MIAVETFQKLQVTSMKKFLIAIVLLLSIVPVSGCSRQANAQIVATTKPVYDFTSALCQNTDLNVSLLVSEKLSCLHDYTLQVHQMRAIESAELLILSGAGLEDFLEDALANADHVIDSSEGIILHCADHSHHGEEHHHEHDPHIWLSVENARSMAQNIYRGLLQKYPQYQSVFEKNLFDLTVQFDQLDSYGKETLSQLSTDQLITFHDGFSYFADYWGLHILHSLEEESGSEASAAELKELIRLVRDNEIPAIFVEENGSTSAAYTVAQETGIRVYALNMGMSGNDYFEVMYSNIDTIREALG